MSSAHVQKATKTEEDLGPHNPLPLPKTYRSPSWLPFLMAPLFSVPPRDHNLTHGSLWGSIKHSDVAKHALLVSSFLYFAWLVQTGLFSPTSDSLTVDSTCCMVRIPYNTLMAYGFKQGVTCACLPRSRRPDNHSFQSLGFVLLCFVLFHP